MTRVAAQLGLDIWLDGGPASGCLSRNATTQQQVNRSAVIPIVAVYWGAQHALDCKSAATIDQICVNSAPKADRSRRQKFSENRNVERHLGGQSRPPNAGQSWTPVHTLPLWVSSAVRPV